MNTYDFKIRDLSEFNLNKIFLHYTNIDNLRGINEKGIEKTKKVFFSIGDKGALIIMDAWLKWLITRPKNKYIYRLGAYLMTKSYFPKFIFDIFFHFYYKNKNKF